MSSSKPFAKPIFKEIETGNKTLSLGASVGLSKELVISPRKRLASPFSSSTSSFQTLASSSSPSVTSEFPNSGSSKPKIFSDPDSATNIIYTSLDVDKNQNSIGATSIKTSSKGSIEIIKNSPQLIEAATLEKLFEKLTEKDDDLQEVFLMAFPTYTTPLKLFSLLTCRFHENREGQANKSVESGVFTFLRKWLNLRSYDFYESTELYALLTNFIKNNSIDSSKQHYSLLVKIRLLDQAYSEGSNTQINSSILTSTYSSSSLLSTNTSSSSPSPIKGSPSAGSIPNISLSNLTSSPSSPSPPAPSPSTPTSNSNSSSSNGTPRSGSLASPSSTHAASPSNKIRRGKHQSITQSSSTQSNSPSPSPSNRGSVNRLSYRNSLNLKGELLYSKLAEQITIIEYDFLHKIRPDEFLSQAWSKKEKETKAPHILESISWFNRLNQYALQEIVEGESADHRAETLALFVQVIKKLLTFNNYNSSMSLLSALHNSSIQRLKKTWKLVPKKVIEDFEQVGNVMMPKSNFKNYRERLSKSRAPTLPYLGMFLTDLTYLDDCKSDYLESLLNVEKIFTIGGRIHEFIQYTSENYSQLENNKQVQEHLLSVQMHDENDIYNISQLREESTHNDDSTKSIDKQSQLFQGHAKSDHQQTFIRSSELTNRDWDSLLTGAKLVTYEKGQLIVDEGEQNFYLYRVKSGKVKMEKSVQQGPPLVQFVQDGALFGDMSIIDPEGKSTAKFSCGEGTVQVYALELWFVLNLIESQAGFAERFFINLSLRVSEQLSEKADILAMSKVSKDNQRSRSGTAGLISASVDSITNTDFSRDATYTNKFGLKEKEIIMHEFSCKMKSPKKGKGTLFIFQKHIGFYNTVLGVERKELINVNHISDIKKNERKLYLSTSEKNWELKFKQDCEEVSNIINSIWKQASSNSSLQGTSDDLKMSAVSRREATLSLRDDPGFEDTLTHEDWQLLEKGVRKETFLPGHIIFSQGDPNQNFYQIISGFCSLKRNVHLSAEKVRPVTVGQLKPRDTFGEIGIVGDLPATFTVKAKTQVEVKIIRGYFISVLFETKPGFAKRFFQRTCNLLAYRMSTLALPQKKSD